MSKLKYIYINVKNIKKYHIISNIVKGVRLWLIEEKVFLGVNMNAGENYG